MWGTSKFKVTYVAGIIFVLNNADLEWGTDMYFLSSVRESDASHIGYHCPRS